MATLAPAAVPTPPASGAPGPAALTLPFRPGDASLTPAETAAIAHLVHAMPQSAAASFSVLAYAPGSPQNPSAARRLALARALAVHDALRAAGVPGSRIFLRAVGPPTGSGAPDRAELRVSAAAGNTP
jgi:outer membrane protein OmpA-like peptidoglycan-associated protein